MSKLPFSLIPTVRPLSRDPTAVADPYKELKELLLRSYGLSDEQRTSKWLDYPMCSGDTRPFVLWDNLTTLQPATIKEAQTALFLRKLPCHISALINTRHHRGDDPALQCTVDVPDPQGGRSRGQPVAALYSSERPQIPLSVLPQDARRRQVWRQMGRRRSPTPGAAKGGRNDGLCFYLSRFGNKAHKCEKGCTYQEN